MKRINFFTTAAIAVLIMAACQKEEIITPAANNAVTDNSATRQHKAKPAGTIWSDCILFGTVAAPNAFKPDAGNFDELYTGGNGFQDGVGAISEAKPGDTDYNGGRWHVNALKSTVDPDKYLTACGVDDLDLNDFESTDTYFSCPLLPRR